MLITINIIQDAEAAECPWPEVEKALRHWAAIHASWASCFRFFPQKSMEMHLDLQVIDKLSAITQLHEELYDLLVNFTVTFHFLRDS